MAGIMDMISNRDTNLDKSIAETTMQCLREMKKQTGENVELVKRINSLVEASVTKIKGIEVKLNAQNIDQKVVEELKQEVQDIKRDFSDELTLLKNQMSEDLNKENTKLYKSVKGLLEEYNEVQQKKMKSLGRFNKLILWFLVLITVLLVTNILGII
jgi:cobalamin biosynthesis protein CbiD